MNNRKSIWIVPIALAVIVAAFYGLTQSRPKPKKVISQTIIQQETGIPVEVAPITVRSVEDALSVTGQLAADSVTRLSTKVPGKVEFVAARQGDRVSRGQLLIRLDDDDAVRQLAQAQAGVQQAQAGLRTARARLSQARTAARVGDAQSAAAVAGARAALRAARARLQQVRTGARRQERIQAENTVALAKSNLDKAQGDFNRYKQLFEQGAVAQAVLDNYRLALDSARTQYNNAVQTASLVEEGARTEEVGQAEAAVQQAQEGLRSAEANAEANVNRQEDVRAALAGVATAEAQIASARATVGIAQQNVQNHKIYAPRTGSITQRDVEPGQYINPGNPLLTVVDLDTVYVQADVSETDVARVKPGMPVNIRAESFPNRVWVGRVESVIPSADAASRTFITRVRVANSGHTLKPGMFARAEIVTGTVENAMLVPKVALITRQGKTSVVRVVNGEADVVPVATGVAKGNSIVVRSPALRKSDKVVVEGQNTLTTGQKVKVA